MARRNMPLRMIRQLTSSLHAHRRSFTRTEKNEAMSHVGKCFCGAVKLEVSGEPEGMGYCHCSSCRSWSGGPVNAFSLWKPENVKIPQGAAHVATFNKTALSFRKYCAKCGGHLMTDHPT